MQIDIANRSEFTPGAKATSKLNVTLASYAEVEKLFKRLIEVENLDVNLGAYNSDVNEFEAALAEALVEAYAHDDREAHLFLQRVLYFINRLKLFWYDDLRRYTNERSSYLRSVRDRIEDRWQRWELERHDLAELQELDVREALIARAADDLNPPPSQDGIYFRERVTRAGYGRLLAIASLDGLVEASQLSRTLGGVANEVHSMLTKLLVEEYGGGRLSRKHSSFFTVMLREFDMSTEPEAYFELVPWEVLAAINHSFLLSERKRHFLRYIGGLLYTEVSVPAGFINYRIAAERLGLSEEARGYWDLHIKEDERHGRWMLYDIALPLVERYPQDAWELVLGYDQQRLFSDRAGAAIAREARQADATA